MPFEVTLRGILKCQCIITTKLYRGPRNDFGWLPLHGCKQHSSSDIGRTKFTHVRSKPNFSFLTYVVGPSFQFFTNFFIFLHGKILTCTHLFFDLPFFVFRMSDQIFVFLSDQNGDLTGPREDEVRERIRYAIMDFLNLF